MDKTKRTVAPTSDSAYPSEAHRTEVREGDASEWIDARASALATRAANARQTSGRRRFVDPTTCDRDYTAAEVEFMQAMQAYKLRSGRMFPTWSEVLEVLHALGYEKALTAMTPAPREGPLTPSAQPA